MADGESHLIATPAALGFQVAVEIHVFVAQPATPVFVLEKLHGPSWLVGVGGAEVIVFVLEFLLLVFHVTLSLSPMVCV
jgi:hypothetical protein